MSTIGNPLSVTSTLMELLNYLNLMKYNLATLSVAK